MPDMARSRVQLTWDNGGPGVVTYYWTSGVPAGTIDTGKVDEFHEEIRASWSLFKGSLVDSVSAVVTPEVEIINPATGAITGVVLASGPTTPVLGTSTSKLLSRGTQACMNLWTDNFTAGKRLRGRHFLGPIAGAAIDTDGSMNTAVITILEDAYVALSSGVGGRLAVWHRPTVKGASDGYYGDVVTVKCKDLPANLKSRRDS